MRKQGRNTGREKEWGRVVRGGGEVGKLKNIICFADLID